MDGLEFDEEKYKKENGYDDVYDSYYASVSYAVSFDTEQVEGDYKGLGYWEAIDNRNANNWPSIVMGSVLKQDYKNFSDEEKAEVDEIEEAVQTYSQITTIEPYEKLCKMFKEIQEKKAEAAKAKAEADAKTKAKEDEEAAAKAKADAEEEAKNQQALQAETLIDNAMKRMYEAWDPRLQRLDYFLLSDKDKNIPSVRVPFSSYTAATAFADQAWRLESGIAQELLSEYGIGKKDGVAEHVGLARLLSESKNKQLFANMDVYQKVIMQKPDLFTSSNKNWGFQSLVNPYSLTKLIGGIEHDNMGSMNYMYDIRDRRRFYGLNIHANNKEDNIFAIDNPTVTQLIEYGNQDSWGRTPYSFQDFVYCKYFGIIPNNRLITLRRYSVPTYDNLQFENMFGDHNTTKLGKNNKREVVNADIIEKEENTANKTFSPHATVVTWFGGDTGNSLSSLMNFTTGIPWTEIESKIYDVGGQEGESPQAVIDKLLGGGKPYSSLFGSPGADHTGIAQFLQSNSFITGKITSAAKFGIAMTGTIGQDQAAFDKLATANVDPYDSTYKNRILGPVNRIDKIKRRKEGIEFQQQLTVKCHYMTKAIGGINPKAALLDVLGNCLEMVSPHAVFWGGGHKFMINPVLYPFHDNGWRDSFMKKVYDGDFLGPEGAIDTILSGIKSVGTDNQGNFSMDTLKSTLGSIGGQALSMVGAAINSIAGIFGGSGLLAGIGNFLNGAGANMQGVSDKDAEKEATKKVNNIFSNLKSLWNNRVVAATQQPNITGMGGLLIGEPVGEWHMTVGNPLNPIMVIGNLICKDAKFTWDEELGPDNFPTGFTVEYALEHGMARDSDAIQSMFNRGMGKYYTLPDFVTLSSERTTHVDKYTADTNGGDTGAIPYMRSDVLLDEAKAISRKTYQQKQVAEGHAASNGGNPDTRLLTKFTPLNALPSQTLSVNAIRQGQGSGTTAVVRSLAATRKMLGNA